MKKLIASLSIVILSLKLIGQIPNNTWRDHFSYTLAHSVAYANDKVYCAAYGGISILDLTDNSIRKLSKVNGLSDVDISKIKYANDADALIITYKNGNIDVIKDNKINNLTDIKRKNTLGDKSINSIEIINGMAYLSTGFGIAVLDYNKVEIKDTYFFGPGGTNINVNDVTSDGEKIYAATIEGIFSADINNPLLIDYNNWEIISDSKNYSHILSHLGKIYAVHYNRPEGGPYDDDIYVLNNDTWLIAEFDPNTTIEDFKTMGDHIFWSIYGRTIKYNPINKTEIEFWTSIPAEIDVIGDNDFWIADKNLGLVHIKDGSRTDYTKNMPIGPPYNEAFSLTIEADNLYVARGAMTSNYKNTFTTGSFSIFSEEKWTTYTNNASRDLISVAVNPMDPERIYVGTWGYGMYEYSKGELTKSFTIENETEHTLEPVVPGTGNIRIGGATFDKDQNLWIANSGVENPISVLKSDGTWKQFNYGETPSSQQHGQIIVTSYGHKWILARNGFGVLVFDTGDDIDDEEDDLTKKLSIHDDKGEVLNNVFSIAEDKNGDIWIGTDKGPVVYYSPQRVFEENLLANRILVPRNDENNFAGILLENETVNAIAIDGANRKWLGTLNSGVFLMSEDGTKELLHFEENNSPLLSNQINDIKIHPKTGEVFIATNKGLISYMGQATEGNEFFTDVYVYPNPIRPDYEGEITITGLVADVNVKITDISGNLVFETTSLGGQAVWNGKNFDGERVHTGVYLVFCTNDDGSKTHVTKLLFIH